VLNLISTQADSSRVTGPYKVFRNLVRGLDAVGYPYVVNRGFRSTPRLWIHDDHVALRHLRAARHANVVVGPNLFVLPRDIPDGVDLRGCLYVHPCDWAVDVWRSAGFEQCPLAAWPVGIDADAFSPVGGVDRKGVLVYHKERPAAELDEIVNALEGEGHDVSVLRYGSYTEDELVERASHAEVVVWHGRHESQGIALEETLALDVPIVVADVSKLSDAIGPYHFAPEDDRIPVTAAPYWDDRCGLVVRDHRKVADAVERILAHRRDYAPRQFVRERLSLAGQARAFVDLWEYFDMSYDKGLLERASANRPWSEPLTDRLGRFARRAGGAVARRLGGS
jgi:hypothetical protein